MKNALKYAFWFCVIFIAVYFFRNKLKEKLRAMLLDDYIKELEKSNKKKEEVISELKKKIEESWNEVNKADIDSLIKRFYTAAGRN